MRHSEEEMATQEDCRRSVRKRLLPPRRHPPSLVDLDQDNCAASVHHRDLSGTAPCESQVKIEGLTASGWRSSNSPAAPSQALKHDRALSDILPEGIGYVPI